MTGQTISHYRILEKLGEGGMGVVYKAEDTKLRRTVALKFLPPHALENRERFLREAQAAAALNHPNICTVHEIDEEHGFLAMELVDGVSVKDKIAARPLPLEEALDIAMQTCAGLAAAHEKGIVHRDIKPANLMLTAQGQVKIMDFGLAQVGDSTRITKTGTSLGTPAYMSPEQAKGDAVDRRTDIWSLGVVLYEMIAGRLPFRGETEQAVSYGIVNTQLEPLTALRSGLPKELDRIAAKVLRKNPGERYSHAEDLLVDLRAVIRPSPATTRARPRAPLLAPIVLVLAVAGWFGWTRLRPPPAATARSLAVLPFRLLTASAADDHLGVGMADSVISKVSQIPGLTVRPTGAVRKFSAADTDTLTAARMLAVDVVLDGNLQRSNDRLRVSVNLIDVATGASLWADTFNVAAADIFAVQDEVALRVAGQLQRRLDSSQQARMVRRHTSNPLAFEYYQKAVRGLERQMTMPLSEYDSVIALFRKAIEADSNYALAHAQLAHTYTLLAVFRDHGNPAWIERAREQLARAEALDHDLAETHIVRSTILASVHGNFRMAEAIQERQLARRLNPSLADPELGNMYGHIGLDDLALRQLSRALQIDPLNETVQMTKAFVLDILERHPEAVAEHQRLFNRPGPLTSLVMLGRLDEAQPLLEARMAASSSPEWIGLQALMLTLRGRFSEVESKIPIIEAGRGHRAYHHATYFLAQIYGLQGRSREAVHWLRITADTGMPNYPVFARDPLLSKIRQSPEYAAFMAELKPRWEQIVRDIEEQ